MDRWQENRILLLPHGRVIVEDEDSIGRRIKMLYSGYIEVKNGLLFIYTDNGDRYAFGTQRVIKVSYDDKWREQYNQNKLISES